MARKSWDDLPPPGMTYPLSWWRRGPRHLKEQGLISQWSHLLVSKELWARMRYPMCSLSKKRLHALSDYHIFRKTFANFSLYIANANNDIKHIRGWWELPLWIKHRNEFFRLIFSSLAEVNQLIPTIFGIFIWLKVIESIYIIRWVKY